jgi:hypothetical protein
MAQEVNMDWVARGFAVGASLSQAPIAAQPPSPVCHRRVQSAMDVEAALVHAIGRRTDGRIRSLQVQIVGSRVVLRGWAVSYHAVQLAIAGLFEAFEAMSLDRPEDVELDIDVSGGDRSCTPRPR